MMRPAWSLSSNCANCTSALLIDQRTDDGNLHTLDQIPIACRGDRLWSPQCTPAQSGEATEGLPYMLAESAIKPQDVITNILRLSPIISCLTPLGPVK